MNWRAAALLLLPMADLAYGQVAAPAGLKGTRWHLVEFERKGDQSLAPDDTSKYHITFDEYAVVRLDCIIGRSTWTVSGTKLRLGQLERTRDACSTGSMSGRIAHDWTDVRTYELRDGALFLILKRGHGRYKLEPDRAPAGSRSGAFTAENLRKYALEAAASDSSYPPISFDAKGASFGPWLRPFLAQLKRKWYAVMPQVAMSLQGHAILTFVVHRDGSITDVAVSTPSVVEPFNEAARSALIATSPTAPLPADYPEESVRFTMTFFYNERPPDTPTVAPPK
jgi:TonB family protein